MILLKSFNYGEALECYAIRYAPKYGDPVELDQLVHAFEQSPQWVAAGEYDKVNEADNPLASIYCPGF